MEEMPVCNHPSIHLKVSSTSEDSEFSSSVDPCSGCGGYPGEMSPGCKSSINGSAVSCNESHSDSNPRGPIHHLHKPNPASLSSGKSVPDDVFPDLISDIKASKDDLPNLITPCESSHSHISSSHVVEERMETESDVMSLNSKRQHGIDVVITQHSEDGSAQSPTLLNHDVNIPDKIAECKISLCSSTSSPVLLQPDRKGRYRHRSGGWIPERTTILEDSSSSRPRLRLSRDHIQPSAGSVSELHGSPKRDISRDEEEEEEDMDEIQPLPRPRSSTCPEIKAFKRKVRVRMMNRPPTPPPGDCPVKRLSGRESSDSGSLELLGSSEDMAADGRMGVRFSLDSLQDESVTKFADDWGFRRQSDSCVLDLPIIEETA